MTDTVVAAPTGPAVIDESRRIIWARIPRDFSVEKAASMANRAADLADEIRAAAETLWRDQTSENMEAVAVLLETAVGRILRGETG